MTAQPRLGLAAYASHTFGQTPTLIRLPFCTHSTHSRTNFKVSVTLTLNLASCQTIKTLRCSFYGVTEAFVWWRNMRILLASIMVLSARCQTHQSCAFFCALSSSVYCTTRSSGSQCLHVCPWWEYNISGRFVSLWEENTPVGPKTMCHAPIYFTVTDWFWNAELPCVNKAKWNTRSVPLLQFSANTCVFCQCQVLCLKK